MTVRKMVLHLFYPAMLGAMFYNYLPLIFSPDILLKNIFLSLSSFLLLFYFVIDYLYTNSYPTYGWKAMFIDLIAITLLYRAQITVNPLINPSLINEPIIMLLYVHLLFICWDIVEGANEMFYLNVPLVVVLILNLKYLNEIFFFSTLIFMNLGFGLIYYNKFISRN